MDLHQLLTPEQAAEILGVSPHTLGVWRSVKRYGLPYVKVGRKVMYRPEHIENFIEERLRDHT